MLYNGAGKVTLARVASFVKSSLKYSHRATKITLWAEYYVPFSYYTNFMSLNSGLLQNIFRLSGISSFLGYRCDFSGGGAYKTRGGAFLASFVKF